MNNKYKPKYISITVFSQNNTINEIGRTESGTFAKQLFIVYYKSCEENKKRNIELKDKSIKQNKYHEL